MPYITGEPNGSSKLSWTASDGATDQYPQATVYDTGGNLVSTVDLTHIADGLYQGNTSNIGAGIYRVVYIDYSDSGHTTANTDYWNAEDVLDVYTKGGSSIRTVSSGTGTVEKIDYEKIANTVWRHKTAKILIDLITEIKAILQNKFNKVLIAIKSVSDKVVIPEYKSELEEFKKVITQHSNELISKIESIEFEQDDVVTPLTEVMQNIVDAIKMPVLDTSVIESQLEILKNRKQEVEIIRDDINIDKIIEQLTKMNELISFLAKDTKIKNIKTKLNNLQNKLRK